MFPTGLGATPITSPAQYPGAGGVYDHSERLQVGYRWHDATGTAPLFPFGHGLSCTTFHYGGLAVRSSGEQAVTVSFDVTNTGGRTGSAAPRVYAGYPAHRRGGLAGRADSQRRHRTGGERRVRTLPGRAGRFSDNSTHLQIWDCNSTAAQTRVFSHR